MRNPQDDPLPPPTKTPPPAMDGLTFVESAKSKKIGRYTYGEKPNKKPVPKPVKRGHRGRS